MGAFVQAPLTSVSVWPCCAVPVIVGAEVFPGAGGTTTAVAADSAGLLVPLKLLAVSCTRSLWPTSAATSTYFCAVAEEIETQLEPEELQRIHW